MSTPVKHGAISLVIHLVAVVIMLVGFKWNIYSLVVGNIVFSLCMCILNSKALVRYAGYHQEFKKTFFLPLGAALVMGITLLASYYGLEILIPRKLATIISVVVAIFVYALFLLKFKALTEDEIVAMPKGKTLLKILRKIHFISEESV